MKTVLFLLAAVLFFPLETRGQDGTKALGAQITDPLKEHSTNSFFGDMHVSLIDTVASRYWGSIVGGIFYTGGAVNFTDLKFTFDDKLGTTYAFVGMINPLDTLKYDHNGGTEYYIAVGKTVEVWKGGPENLPLLKFNAMVLYDAISRVNHFNDDVIQQYLRIDFGRVPVAQPYLEGYHWFQSGDKSPPVGWFGRAGVHRQQPLGFDFRRTPVELGLDASIGYSSEGLFGRSSGLAYYRGVVSTVFKVNKHLIVIPSIVGQLPGNQKPEPFVDHERLFYNLTIQWNF